MEVTTRAQGTVDWEKRALEAEALMKEYAARIIRTRQYIVWDLGPWPEAQTTLLALLDGTEVK
jgi:hypothetical protein